MVFGCVVTSLAVVYYRSDWRPWLLFCCSCGCWQKLSNLPSISSIPTSLFLEVFPFLKMTFQMPETKDRSMHRKSHTEKAEPRLIFRDQVLCMAYLHRNCFTYLSQSLRNELCVFTHILNKQTKSKTQSGQILFRKLQVISNLKVMLRGKICHPSICLFPFLQ